MAPPVIPTRLLRLAEALVFASPRPATWGLLTPFLPADLSADDVFAALAVHCAERGVVLVQQADGWVFRTAPDLNAALQAALGEVRKLPRVAFSDSGTAGAVRHDRSCRMGLFGAWAGQRC